MAKRGQPTPTFNSVKAANWKKHDSLEAQEKVLEIVKSGIDLLPAMKELIPDLEKAIFNEHGNFAAQKAVTFANEECLEWICSELTGQAERMAKNKFACRVLNRLIERVKTSMAVKRFLLQLEGKFQSLASDCFGNYVVQHLISNCPDIPTLDNAYDFEFTPTEKHWFRCNVIEHALELGHLPVEKQYKIKSGNFDEFPRTKTRLTEALRKADAKRIQHECRSQQQAQTAVAPAPSETMCSIHDFWTLCYFNGGWLQTMNGTILCTPGFCYIKHITVAAKDDTIMDRDDDMNDCILEYLLTTKQVQQLKQGMVSVHLNGDVEFARGKWTLVIESLYATSKQRRENSASDVYVALSLKYEPVESHGDSLSLKVMTGPTKLAEHDFRKNQICRLSDNFLLCTASEGIAFIGLTLEKIGF